MPQPDGSHVLFVRGGEGEDWRPLVTFGYEEALFVRPLSFNSAGDTIPAISAASSDTAGLVSIDVKSRDVEVLASLPGADIEVVRLHPVTKAPQVAAFAKERME